jgi:hypothetical protein
MVKKVYWFRWMNRTKYIDGQGKLIIKTTPRFKDEEKARSEFDRVSKLGYAVQLKCAELEMMDCINFSNHCKSEKRDVEVKTQVLEENGRWKLRMKEKEIDTLFHKKEQMEASLKAIKEQLKKLQEE